MNRTLKKIGVTWEYDIPNLKNSTPIQLKSYELYSTKDINTFSLEDIRFMIGQEIGIEFLLPKAFEQLEKDIFLEVNYYEGDLLSVVLKLPSKFWKNNQEERDKILKLLKINQDRIESLDVQFSDSRTLKKIINQFLEEYDW